MPDSACVVDSDTEQTATVDPSRDQREAVAASEWVNELLLGMRLSGLNYRHVKMTPPFGLAFDNAVGCAQFHFVAQGSVALRIGDGDLQHLYSGDAVLLPRGVPHHLLSAPDADNRDIAGLDAIPLCDAFSCIDVRADTADETPSVQLFSGCMQLDLGGMQPLIEMMPPVMHVGTMLSRFPELLPMLEAMAREARLERAGAAGILSRLADVVAASIIRGWVECGCDDIGGWIAALRDPRLGRVIAAVHREPGRAWSVATMADEMRASRSVFAARFRASLGITPLEYVTQLRMRLATQWMREKGLSIEDTAWRLGYGSQAAFARAFKRATGATPGAVKQASS